MLHAYINRIHLLGADKIPHVLKILSLYDWYSADLYSTVYEYTTGSFCDFPVTTSCTVSAGVRCGRVKRPGSGFEIPAPPSAEVWTGRSCTPTSLLVFMQSCFRQKFTCWYIHAFTFRWLKFPNALLKKLRSSENGDEVLTAVLLKMQVFWSVRRANW
jgi:hypothetical protein